jgi:hypothetical protein
MEYFVFLKYSLGLIGALSAAIYIWSRRGTDKIEKPIKTEDGNFVITKPEDIELEDGKYDGIVNK